MNKLERMANEIDILHSDIIMLRMMLQRVIDEATCLRLTTVAEAQDVLHKTHGDGLQSIEPDVLDSMIAGKISCSVCEGEGEIVTVTHCKWCDGKGYEDD